MAKTKLVEKSAMKWVDIYDYYFEVVVSNNIIASRNHPKRAQRLGGVYVTDDIFYGLHAFDSRNSCIIFNEKGLTHDTIAHEVFHASNRIMEWIEHRIGPKTQEPGAYLCGYLTQFTYDNLKKWGVKIK